jgi:hypothetical protein
MVEFEALKYSSRRNRGKFINHATGQMNLSVAECYVSFRV